MGISSQWWNHHGILLSESTDLKHDRSRMGCRQCTLFSIPRPWIQYERCSNMRFRVCPSPMLLWRRGYCLTTRGKEVVSMSTAIRPFTFDVAAADLDDLQSRLGHTRWPERETSPDWNQGIPLAYTQDVCAYWR